jgi:hypothetical protein
MAEKIANSNSKKSPYVKPAIRTFDVSELPEEWINALRSSAQLQVPEEIKTGRNKAKAAVVRPKQD